MNPWEDLTMRWFYLTLIVVFAAATLIFALQNLQVVDVSFLRLGVRTPLAFLVGVIYVLGALTGGSLFALLRRSIEGARRPTTAS
jgi:uncharacterized integral membrane protein